MATMYCALSRLPIYQSKDCLFMYIERTSHLSDKSLFRYTKDQGSLQLFNLFTDWVPASIVFDMANSSEEYIPEFMDSQIQWFPKHQIKAWFEQEKEKQKQKNKIHFELDAHSTPYGVLCFHKQAINESFDLLSKADKNDLKDDADLIIQRKIDLFLNLKDSSKEFKQNFKRVRRTLLFLLTTSMPSSSFYTDVLLNAFKGIPIKSWTIEQILPLCKILHLYSNLEIPFNPPCIIKGGDSTIFFKKKFYANAAKILRLMERASEEDK